MTNENDNRGVLQKYIKRKRTDLSAFLIHLTREYDGISAYKNLFNILEANKIEARNAYGYFQYDSNANKVVCFTEAPLDQIKAFTGIIPGRSIKLSKYGLVFTQKFIVKVGGNPSFYINAYAKPNKYLDALKNLNFTLNLIKNESIQIGQSKIDMVSAKKDFDMLKPFFNKFGKDIDFYWEREWRVPADVSFNYEDIVVGLCPEQFIDNYEKKYSKVKFIDPEWSLEEIITKLII